MKEKTVIIESVFKHKGLKCVVLFLQSGHRCGYVGIKESSPFFGVEYNSDLTIQSYLKKLKKFELGEKVSPELLFDVHGGITYSKDQVYLINTKSPTWWLGFDCRHYNDGKDFDLMQKHFPAYYSYLARNNLLFSHGPVRTKEYCEQECKNLAEQIIEYEMILKEE